MTNATKELSYEEREELAGRIAEITGGKVRTEGRTKTVAVRAIPDGTRKGRDLLVLATEIKWQPSQRIDAHVDALIAAGIIVDAIQLAYPAQVDEDAE